MHELWLPAGAIIVGFIGLIWGADRFVEGSASIANNLGISKLIIGLTIVSFGTSAPEIIVAISASLQGTGDLAIGNALGSNLANIGLVLGITAIIAPLPIQRHLLVQEIPILLVITIIAGFLLYDATLGYWDGILLLTLLIPLLLLLIKLKKNHSSQEGEVLSEILPISNANAVFWLGIGLLILIASSEALVWGAKITAGFFEVSPMIIGLTVVAIGTSLPELAASVTSAIKNHHDIALGNIIGSNIFNILAVMAIPGLFNTVTMDIEVFNRDYLYMAGITVLLSVAIVVDYYLRNRANSANGHLGRRIGIVLLLAYLGYYFILYSAS